MSRPEWTGAAVAKMHIFEISGVEVAKQLGWTPEWTSRLLTGKATTKTAEMEIMGAIDRIIEQRTSGS